MEEEIHGDLSLFSFHFSPADLVSDTERRNLALLRKSEGQFAFVCVCTNLNIHILRIQRQRVLYALKVMMLDLSTLTALRKSFASKSSTL